MCRKRNTNDSHENIQPGALPETPRRKKQENDQVSEPSIIKHGSSSVLRGLFHEKNKTRLSIRPRVKKPATKSLNLVLSDRFIGINTTHVTTKTKLNISASFHHAGYGVVASFARISNKTTKRCSLRIRSPLGMVIPRSYLVRLTRLIPRQPESSFWVMPSSLRFDLMYLDDVVFMVRLLCSQKDELVKNKIKKLGSTGKDLTGTFVGCILR